MTPPKPKNGGIPIIQPPPDPLALALKRADRDRWNAEWGAAFDANAKQGAPSLLAFLMSGVQYDQTTVLKTALEIIAAMKVGGYLIIRADQFEAQVRLAIETIRAREAAQEVEGDQG